MEFGWLECHTELNKTKNLKVKEICLAVAETTDICAMLKVSKLYASEQSGFEKNKTKSKEWKSKVDRECEIAGLPYTGN